jgi:AAA15 family ATPase/GTPase
LGDSELLLRFGVGNFRSISGYQEFSMISDSAIKDRVDTLYDIETPSVREPLLAVAVIYGANASGKSNLLKGFEYMRRQIIYSHNDLSHQRGNERQPFRLDQTQANEPTKCDVDFVWNNTRYHYGFEAADEVFVGEWLFDFPSGRRRMLFERSGPLSNDVAFGSSTRSNVHDLAKFMRPDSLLVSVASQNNFADFFPVVPWARSVIAEMAGAMPLRGFSFRNQRYSRIMRTEAIDQRITDFLKIINTGISSFAVVEEKSERFYTSPQRQLPLKIDVSEDIDVSKERIYETTKRLYALHRSKTGEPVHFDMNEESSGTQRIFLLLDLIFTSLDRGTLLVVDEMDSSLHTLVGEKVLGLYMNKKTNPRGAQLLVTTHDTNLMGHDALRRDQIWFTEKDEYGATHVFPLTDFKARRGQNVEKGYLEGRFGAIPYSGDISRFLEKNDD